MKTIGLIGGMSWESSKLYYEHINKGVKEVLGGSHSAKSVMVSVDFSEIEKLTFEDQWEDIGKMMAIAGQQLQNAGADVILLCTNTIHLVSDMIVKNTSLPFLHIANATGEAIKQKQLKKVGLLGTMFTMEKDFYTGILKNEHQIEAVIPPQKERQIVHDIIYGELVLGKFTNTSKKTIIRIIENLKQKGAEGVILGCTELPLLVSNSDVDVPLFDTAKIHAQQAVKWALKEN